MNIFKSFFSFFKKKNKQNYNIIKKTKPKGQEYIYWRNYINKKNLKFIIPFILLLSLILLISPPPVTVNQIYIENFEYEFYCVNRGNQYDKILYSLVINEHEKSFKLLKEAIKKDSTQYMYIFYYSVIAMELDKHEIAQKYLKKLKNSDCIFVEDAQWFLALSYLKTDKEKSIDEFRKISKDKSHYKQKIAKRILRKLK